ncbi:MAG: HAMP domain-containing protein [Candidatus Riflebacteria bacterium]|nr:HAMP domain-containing protein [Candidatus Riflebacteria bacterium]
MLFLSVVLPVLFLGIFLSVKLNRELTSQAITRQETITSTIRQGLHLQLKSWIDAGVRLSEKVSLQSLDREKIEKDFISAFSENSCFYSLFVYDKTGKVITLSYRNRNQNDNSLIGKSIAKLKARKFSNRDKVFHKVISTNSYEVCDSVWSYRNINQFLVMFPIREFDNPKNVIGVLSCGIHLEGIFFQELLRSFFRSEEGFLMLSDSYGRVIACTGEESAKGLEKISLSRPLKNSNTESVWTKILNRDYLVTITPISDLKCNIFLAAPRDFFMGFITEILWGMLAFTIVSLIIAGFLGWLFAGRMIQPLLNLVDGIKKVSEGVLSHRIETSGNDEIATVCRSFNEMTAGLEKKNIIEEIWSRSWNRPN